MPRGCHADAGRRSSVESGGGETRAVETRPCRRRCRTARPAGRRRTWSVPVRRRHRAPVREPRLRRLDERLPVGHGRRRAVRPLVLERAPRSGIQVAARNRRLRVGPGHSPRLRRRWSRQPGTSPSCAETPPRRSTISPTGLRLEPDDVVLTTVVEHHANLSALGAGRAAGATSSADSNGTFDADDVVAGLDEPPAAAPRPHRRLERHGMAAAARRSRSTPPTTGACPSCSTPPSSPRTGPSPPRPTTWPSAATSSTPPSAPASSWDRRPPSPRATRSWPAEGRWTSSTSTRCGGPSLPSARRRARPTSWGPWHSRRPSTSSGGSAGTTIAAHEQALAGRLRRGLAADRRRAGARTRRSTPTRSPSPPSWSRACTTPSWRPGLSAEWGIGVRHGCFCAHPYLIRLLGLSSSDVSAYREQVIDGDHRSMPGAVRASCSLSSTAEDVSYLLEAVSAIAKDASEGTAPAVPYVQDRRTGDFWPVTDAEGWTGHERQASASCARG